ncbi:MAG: alpha/beta fold hydrolase [Alphaproteobacteria bacterium]|nr:alpha/beta fold hydrolase [Alphaproteobacteria bacterium]
MKKLFVLCFLFLAACATENPLKDLRFQPISSGDYTVASWYKITKPGLPLKVYIEGDGHAFDSKGQPTKDPTPEGLFLRKLAVDDTYPNVVYLARPCQYLMGQNCCEKDWTTGRFSSSIIDTMEASVGILKKKSRADEVILIGYSGGGMIASQIAVRHPKEVKKLITIAGVLDKDKWTSYHKDEPLTDSVNLKVADLKGIPQTHYVGAKDKIVPPELTFEILGKDNPNVVVVSSARHDKGFDKIYADVWSVR